MRNFAGIFAAVALTACGTAAEPQTDLGIVHQAACYTEACDSKTSNGRGIFNVEGGEYCHDGYCPNYLLTTGLGSSFIVGFDTATQSMMEVELLATVNKVPGMKVASIDASSTWLSVTYTDTGGKQHKVDGPDLGAISLFYSLHGQSYEVRFLDPQKPNITNVNGVYEYDVQIRRNGASAWEPMCLDDQNVPEQASFLQGSAFDPFTADRTDSPKLTTMSCKRGGITTCLEWGYQPDKYGADLHNSCVQMKRAAYCGDESYTHNGTQIGYMDDIIPLQMPNKFLEAMWTPHGAACLNEDHRRRPDIKFLGCTNPLPPCKTDDGTQPDFGYGDLSSSNDVK